MSKALEESFGPGDAVHLPAGWTGSLGFGAGTKLISTHAEAEGR